MAGPGRGTTATRIRRRGVTVGGNARTEIFSHDCRIAEPAGGDPVEPAWDRRSGSHRRRRRQHPRRRQSGSDGQDESMRRRIMLLLPIILACVAASSDSCALHREGGLYDRTGPHELAVIMVDFEDATNPETPADAFRAVFTGEHSVDAYYQRASYGRFWLRGRLDEPGDVFGPVRIPFSSFPCRWEEWAQAARKKLARSGFVAEHYDFVFYIFAGECRGFGRPGWTPPSMVLGGLSRLGLLHEGGHAFGWAHAASYNCREHGVRTALSTRECVHVEYGDPFSLMGGGGTGPVNQVLRGQFGWFVDSNTLTMTQDGEATVARIEEATDDVQVVRIPRIVGAGGVEEFLYVEAREAVEGVLLRLAPRYDVAARPRLLDATPETESFHDAGLALHHTFTDPATGTTIVPTAIDGEGRVTVEVTVGEPLVCKRRPPTGWFAPGEATAAAGEEIVLEYQLQNNDVNCPSALFLGSIELPAGWPLPATSPDRPPPPDDARLEATIFPGMSAALPLRLVPPGGVRPGEYTVRISVRSDSGTTASFSRSLTIVESGRPSRPPHAYGPSRRKSGQPVLPSEFQRPPRLPRPGWRTVREKTHGADIYSTDMVLTPGPR